jgi:hypothetical protein
MCHNFLIKCGYKIVVDDSGRPALSVEIEALSFGSCTGNPLAYDFDVGRGEECGSTPDRANQRDVVFGDIYQDGSTSFEILPLDHSSAPVSRCYTLSR